MKTEKIHYILLICFFTVLSCKNPFSTREPEKPNSVQSSWIQPTSPGFVLINLRNAIAEKNITNYLRCLADTSHSQKIFRFIPEPTVANNYPGLFDKWGKEQEQTYLSQLLFFLPEDSISELTLESLREDTFQDSVILSNKYELRCNYKCNSKDCYHDMMGQVEFRLTRTSEDLWYISRWSDYAIGLDATWSQLKAYFGK
jgi:hypothetical protein